MVQPNHAQGEITFQVVCDGCALSGETSSPQVSPRFCDLQARGRLLKLKVKLDAVPRERIRISTRPFALTPMSSEGAQAVGQGEPRAHVKPMGRRVT